MAEAASEPSSPSKLRWVLGWIVLPGSIIAALFFAGVHVGARHPDMGLARLLLKMFGATAGVAEPPEPQKSRQRPGAKPGEPFSYSEILEAEQMQAIADQSLGLSVAELDCDYVCRAYSKAEFQAPVYAVDQCTLARATSTAPTWLVCRGKLEAITPAGDSKSDSTEQKPSD